MAKERWDDDLDSVLIAPANVSQELQENRQIKQEGGIRNAE
jgi:hypothetical protein